MRYDMKYGSSYEMDRVKSWVIFGESRDGTLADVCDADHTIFVNLPREIANQVVELHDEFMSKLKRLLTK